MKKGILKSCNRVDARVESGRDLESFVPCTLSDKKYGKKKKEEEKTKQLLTNCKTSRVYSFACACMCVIDCAKYKNRTLSALKIRKEMFQIYVDLFKENFGLTGRFSGT